jgi:DNA-binding transcriptional LysR family regulator
LPGANQWHFSGPEGDYVVPVAGNYSSNSGPALYEAVKRGIGLARMLEHVAREEIDAGRIEAIFEDQTRSSYFLTAYYPRSERVPAKTQAFLNFLRQRLAALDASAAAHD